ncbi:hypothetical protein PR048_025649 [Dryococelus australis]|uniref:Integrase catalytic domain-containing protein n=1 Tax=Dryococelus australis TaxID=614101 RepID=A0ABQ9GJ62_9NEOP|nr:hypothetical protein PR048_025649 [Dryococelus australis]
MSRKKYKRTVRSITLINTKIDNNWMYQYFSKYERIVRMVGWILRFVNNCRPEKPKETNSRGLIRLNTKIIERKEDISAFRTPVVLPSIHPVVERLVYDLHCICNHVGAHSLLSLIREKFWIIKGGQAVWRIIQKCVTWRRYNVRSFDTYSLLLPDPRVNEASIFEVVGINLTGLLILRDGQNMWICLFTCAIYRAIHLELVPSLSFESFLLAFCCFVARGGRPKVIYSDNGTNFRGTENMFATLDWKQIAKYSTTKRIDWRFNLPSAAWCGGFWERLMGLGKQLLRRTLRRAAVASDELHTIICDCEAQINSRPITYLSDDNADLYIGVPLTPSMFLQDVQYIGVPLTPSMFLQDVQYIGVPLTPSMFLQDVQYIGVPLTPSMFLQDVQYIGVPDCNANEACSMTQRGFVLNILEISRGQRGKPLENLLWDRLSSLDQTISKDQTGLWPLLKVVMDR